MAASSLNVIGLAVSFDLCCGSSRPDFGLQVTPGRYGHLTCGSTRWPMDVKAISWTSRSGEYREAVTGDAEIVDEVCQIMFEVLTCPSSVLVTYNMEWKALVIEAKLKDCGLHFLARVWSDLARDGICLMGLRTSGNHGALQTPLTSLATLCRSFLLGASRQQARPDPGKQAKLYWQIANGVACATLPPCARGLAKHNLQEVPVEGPRDNGERDCVCTECGMHAV